MSSYSTELVVSKLSNLNDTQESITSVSQCIHLVLTLADWRGVIPSQSGQ